MLDQGTQHWIEESGKSLQRIADSLERLCPGGSESGDLLPRREAEEDKATDGEQRRVSCARCADKDALVERLEGLVEKWRRVADRKDSDAAPVQDLVSQALLQNSATNIRCSATELDWALKASAERA